MNWNEIKMPDPVGDAIKEVREMDAIQKLSVYMHYFVTCTEMKHNFEIVNYKTNCPDMPGWPPGYGKPDKEFGKTRIYFLWKNTRIQSFEDFISENNIEQRTPTWREVYGIFDWYLKFKEQITII